MFTALNTWLRFSDRCGDGSKMLAGLWGWVRTALSRVKSDSFVDPSIWTSPLCRLLGLVTGEAAHPTTTISYVGCDVSIFSQCGSCNIGHPTDYAVSVFSFLTDESFMCLTKHEPVGVCGAIIPVSPKGIWFEFSIWIEILSLKCLWKLNMTQIYTWVHTLNTKKWQIILLLMYC